MTSRADHAASAIEELRLDTEDAGVPSWAQEPGVIRLGDKIVYDITLQYRSAAENLPVGELLKDEQFTLFESVAALEIMDPKMDSGHLAPGESPRDDYNVLREHQPEEILGIMDQLLCYEMAWHTGYPLAQTVFGCHYIDKIYLYSEHAVSVSQVSFESPLSPLHRAQNVVLIRVLKNYCLGFIKCCQLVYDAVMNSLHYYEEEDFSTNPYGRDFLPSVDVAEVIAAINDDIDLLSAASDTPETLRFAMIDRLSLRNQMISAMCAQASKDIDSAPYWHRCLRDLENVNSSHHSAKPVPTAFSDKIQRRLASTQPPKPLVEITFLDAMDKLRQLCRDCLEVERILDCVGPSAEQCKVLLLSFNARKPEPLPYPRACLSRNVLEDSESIFREFMICDFKEVIMAGEQSLDPVHWTVERPPRTSMANPSFETARAIDALVTTFLQSIGGYMDLFRALLSNRCRLRRNLSHVFRVFDDIEEHEAVKADSVMTSYWKKRNSMLRVWTHFHKIRCMVMYIQLGFELEVYQPWELGSMYWYLKKISYDPDFDYLWEMKSILDEKARTAGAGATSTVTDAARIEVNTALNFVLGLNNQMAALTNLSGALYLLYQLLSYVNLLPAGPTDQNPISADPKRWEARMKPFVHIHNPRLPTWEEMYRETHILGPYQIEGVGGVSQPPKLAKTDLIQLCENIETRARMAKECFAKYKARGPGSALAMGAEEFWERDVEGCLQSAMGVVIAQATLKKALIKDGPGKLTAVIKMPGKWHDWWIVPELIETGGMSEA